MNRTDARKIAETITNEQLKAMFDKAKFGVKDWSVVSSVNRLFTKGTAWNILAKNFDVNAKHHTLVKTNMIREFGEFLPKELNPSKSRKLSSNKPPVHQDPEF